MTSWRFVVLAVALGGCALTTPAPAGPVRAGSVTSFETTFAYAYGPARATINGTTVTGNGQQTGGGRSTSDFIPDEPPTPIPLAVGLRQSAGGRVDVSADLGWMDSGVGVRLRLPSPGGERVPAVLSAGFRTGHIAAFTSDTYAGTLAAEAYPEISRHPGWHLILSLGLAGGVFQHQLLLPEVYDSDSDAPHGAPTMIALRRELRLQTSIGVYVRGDHGGVGITLSPWFLLAAAAPSMTCDDCSDVMSLQGFSQSWGVALAITPSLDWAAPR